jgi:hypothetical protein
MGGQLLIQTSFPLCGDWIAPAVLAGEWTMIGLEHTVALDEARDLAEAILNPPDEVGRWGFRADEAAGEEPDCMNLLLEGKRRR